MDAPKIQLKRIHARRLREVYRSSGWPSLDGVEIELLAVGLLERVVDSGGLECVRVKFPQKLLLSLDLAK